MRRALFALIATLTLLPGTLAAVEFDAITLGFSQAWTGNGYVPNPGGTYNFDVTGSEAMPIDGFARIGVRLSLLSGFISQEGVLALAPSLEFGLRRYALFESGRVVPAPAETGAVEEDGVAGPGTADVLTIRIPLAFHYQITYPSGAVLHTSASPTTVLRFPVANEVVKAGSSLSGMSDWFYGQLRFLQPEIGVGYRIQVSPYLEAGVKLEYSLSLLDLFDAGVPFYDQMRLALGFELSLIPPFSGLARPRDPDEAL
jgi:hypothetical protein